MTEFTLEGRRAWLIAACWCGALLSPSAGDAAAPVVGTGAAGAPVVETIYRVRPSGDLTAVNVEVVLPPEVGALRAAAGVRTRLEALTGCDDQVIETGRDLIFTGSAQGCLRYRYPLDPSSGRRSPAVAKGAKVTAPDQWLWLPADSSGKRAATRIRIELQLGERVLASVPWRRIGENTYELRPSPESATASVVFGDFDLRELELEQARLSVALVDGPADSLDAADILKWLKVAAEDVAAVSGVFPNPELQVIVQPVRTARSRSAVPFGFVIRDGGEAVRFYVDPRRSLEDYLQDWTATHEFSHLLLPYVRSREKWVSEGFASYFQNVLLARRGVYSEREAWTRLHRAFEQARGVVDPPPLDRLGERSFWEMRMLIYWIGAATALQADVRLRAGSDGAESLDTVLGRLRECCLPSERVWRAAELFDTLDRLAPVPVFRELFDARMGGTGMPDLTSLYRDLGIVVDGAELRLTDDGRLSAVRKAIMRR